MIIKDDDASPVSNFPENRFKPRYPDDEEYAIPVRMTFKQAMIDRRKNDDRDYYPD